MFFCWVKLRFRGERDKVLTTDAILRKKKPSCVFKDRIVLLRNSMVFVLKVTKKIGVRREDAHHINNDENECIGVRDKVA